MPVVGRAPPRTLPRPTTKVWRQGDRPQLDPVTRSGLSWVKEIQDVSGGWLYELRRQWAINKAVRIGQQYARFDGGQARTGAARKNSKNRVRLSVNVIHPVVQTFIALLLKTKPALYVMPATGDIDDRDRAKVAEKILDHEWRANGMDSQLVALAGWLFETGAAFTETWWDPTSGGIQEAKDEQGNPLYDPDSGKLLVDKNGKPLRYALGRTRIATVPPFQITADLNAMTWDEINWVNRGRMMPLSEIRRRWWWGQFVNPEPFDVNNSVESQFNRLTAANSSGDFGTLQGRSEWARVNTCYVRPGQRVGDRIYEDGALIIECQGMGHIERIPFEDAPGYDPQVDWNPFTMFRCYEVGRFWPMGVIDNVWPINKEINRLESGIMEWVGTSVYPKWLLPSGCGVTDKQLTREAGEKVRYNQTAGPPKMVDMPPLPATVMQMLQHMHENVDTVSSQHGPSRGQAPSNIKSGIGLSLLQEQDATDMGPITTLFEGSLAQLGRQILLRDSQFWKEDRLVRVMGKNRQIEVFRFSSADLGGNVDVHVEAGSGLPKSKAAQQSYAKVLVELGLYSPMIPDQRRKLLQIMETGDVGEVFDTSKDRRRAQFENDLMVKGLVMPQPAWYEDGDAHLQEHIDFMKGDIYEKAKAENPQVEAFFQMHLMMTFQNMSQLGGQSAMPGLGGSMAGPGDAMGTPTGPPQAAGFDNGPSDGSLPGMKMTQSQDDNRAQTAGSGPLAGA